MCVCVFGLHSDRNRHAASCYAAVNALSSKGGVGLTSRWSGPFSPHRAPQGRKYAARPTGMLLLTGSALLSVVPPLLTRNRVGWCATMRPESGRCNATELVMGKVGTNLESSLVFPGVAQSRSHSESSSGIHWSPESFGVHWSHLESSGVI